LASSRWSRGLGSGQALVRLSEVEDWEEGGRTGAHHLGRILQREQHAGTGRVLAALRQVGRLLCGRRAGRQGSGAWDLEQIRASKSLLATRRGCL
jgi:hypothetical protein